MTLVVKYAFFAAVATTTNIGAQHLSLYFYNGAFSLYIAMFLGTLIGLLVKYILDKKYVFSFTALSLREDTNKFILYSFMGIITTLIFWGSELSFNALFSHAEAKYIGAILGLTIGYLIKYHLDRKFVFQRK